MAKTLNEYIEFFEALHKTFIHSHSFESSPALQELTKLPRLMIILNHATPLSWLPAMTTLGVEFQKSGGGHRTPRGIVDKWFYSNPISKPLAEYLSQSDKPQTFDEIVEQFAASENVDLVISPEGANTFFGDVRQVQEFRSHRYIEIAIRTKCPILVVAHKGSESWSIPLQVPKEISTFVNGFSNFFGSRLQQFGNINLPIIPHKIDHFKVKAQVFYPSLSETELSDDKAIRTEQIREQSLQVKQLLEKLLSDISTTESK